MRIEPIPVVENIAASLLSRHLARGASPLVVTGALRSWPAMTAWSFDWFKAHFGNFPIEAFAPQLSDIARFGVKTSLARYLDYIADRDGGIVGEWLIGDASAFAASGETLYAGNFNPAHPRFGDPDKIFDYVPATPAMIDCWFRLLDPTFVALCRRVQSHHYVYLSAPGAYTPFHADFWATHAFLAQISGRKRAVLIAPGHASVTAGATRDDRLMRNDDRYRDVTAWSAELDPGHLLVIPSGWLHAVETLTPSITYSADWIDGANWRAYLRGATMALRRKGWSG